MWSKLTGVSTSLARSIWIFTAERKGAIGKDDLLGKVSFMNLIVALALSLKYKLRFKPYIQYDDLHDLVSHLDTFARDAGEPTVEKERGAMLQHIQNLLRLAEVNPRRELKRAKRPLGNLPIEILSYMSAYISSIVSNETLRPPNVIPSVLNALQEMNDILVTADRILNTPLPIAYTIAISQITWIYIITFTIQLVTLMGWLTIPTTVVASYIILGFAAIGNEIENPFGVEVNDLPLEQYCAQIASDIAIISSRPPPKLSEYALHPDNKPLYPISSAGSAYWPDASIEDIRDALKTRAMISKPTMWRRQSMPPARGMSGGQSLRGHRDDSHDSTVVGEAHEMKNDRSKSYL